MYCVAHLLRVTQYTVHSTHYKEMSLLESEIIFSIMYFSLTVSNELAVSMRWEVI